MTEQEKWYRSAVNRLAGALLMFIVVSNVLSLAVAGIQGIYEPLLAEHTAYVLTTILNGIVYILNFVLPVGFFCLISRGKPCEPIRFTPKLPKETFAYIFAGMAVILAAAYLNYLMISFTHYSEFSSEMLWTDRYDTVTDVVLAFATTAIIPGFVEELLFRGLVLTNLRPYGRVTAIVGSAVLFGLMHQNVEQVFYATMAGLVLGYVYDVTGSIWCGVLLHMSNNAFSVFESVIAARWEEASANKLCALAEGVIVGVGIGCLIWLTCRKHSEKHDFAEGVFGSIPEPVETDVPCDVAPDRKLRLFFSPLMITYMVACFANMLLFIALAALYHNGLVSFG